MPITKRSAIQRTAERETCQRGLARVARSPGKAMSSGWRLERGRHAATKMELHEPYRSMLHLLHSERQRLRDRIARQELLRPDHPIPTTHLADDASDVAEQETGLALRRHLEAMLHEIDRAIQRAERGALGLCERCGRPIDPERLRAVPWVTLCISCARSPLHSPKAMRF